MGIMSGTSADGVDAAVIEMQHDDSVSIIGTHTTPYPPNLKKQIRAICAERISSRSHARELESVLTQQYAAAALALIAATTPKSVDVIGCHGQTVHHSPNSTPPFSVQLVDGDALAQLTGSTVVTDFRSADLLAGGQGAPLAPGLHNAQFRSAECTRVIVNIGGIANITCLPKDAKADVIGFDSGPGNTLIDYWCREHLGCEYDRNGDMADIGRVQPDLLALMYNDPYFARPWPKSTGLEYFNDRWLNEKLALWGGMDHASKTDILATLTALSAYSIVQQIRLIQPVAEEVYICGGGAKNRFLARQIAKRSKLPVCTTTALGIDPQWIEAAAFGWMAERTLRQLPSTLPAVTGAKRATIAGTVSLPPGQVSVPVGAS